MKKVFIITGANRGLGESFAHLLIQNEEHFVISISRSINERQKAYSSSSFYWLKADLSEGGLSEKLIVFGELIDRHEVFFINNASVIMPIAKISDIEEKAVSNTLDVNIKAPITITQFLLRYFNANKLSFINISSGAAQRPIANWSLYCSAKAYIEMFFKVAESENAEHRFFNINPGVIDTNMQAELRASDFPDVVDFQDLKKEGKLRSTEEVALEIINTIL